MDSLPFALKAPGRSAQGKRSATLGIPRERVAPWKGAGKMARARISQCPFRARRIFLCYPGRRCALPWAGLPRPFRAKESFPYPFFSIREHGLIPLGNALVPAAPLPGWSLEAKRSAVPPPPQWSCARRCVPKWNLGTRQKDHTFSHEGTKPRKGLACLRFFGGCVRLKRPSERLGCRSRGPELAQA